MPHQLLHQELRGHRVLQQLSPVAVSPTLFSGALSSSRVREIVVPPSRVRAGHSTNPRLLRRRPAAHLEEKASVCRDSAEVPVRALVRRSSLPSLVVLDTAPARPSRREQQTVLQRRQSRLLRPFRLHTCFFTSGFKRLVHHLRHGERLICRDALAVKNLCLL